MCTSCLSTVEAAVGQVALAAFVLKQPVHRVLARLEVAPAPDPVAHDVRTVAFLHSLDLDPVQVLGEDVVAAAAQWRPAPAQELAWGRLRRRWASSAAPIRSQSRAALT